jgi:hypothetical protein
LGSNPAPPWVGNIVGCTAPDGQAVSNADNANPITLGDQTSMVIGTAVVLQRVLTLTYSEASVSNFNLAFCSALAFAIAVRLVVEWSSLLETVFAAMILPACFVAVYRVEKVDDEAFRRQ